MEQTVELPNSDDMEKIAQLLAISTALTDTVSGEVLEGSKHDLDLIQAVIDSDTEDTNATLALQSLGMALGQVLANDNSDYDWWMVDDDDGRDPCLRFKDTNLLVFPQTIISKRVEEGKTVDVVGLYDQLVEQLEEVREQHFGNA